MLRFQATPSTQDDTVRAIVPLTLSFPAHTSFVYRLSSIVFRLSKSQLNFDAELEVESHAFCDKRHQVISVVRILVVITSDP